MASARVAAAAVGYASWCRTGSYAAASAKTAVLGLPALLGPAGRWRELAMALIVSRVVAPAPKLAARHLAEDVNPSRMALFDLSSSWVEGRHSPSGRVATRGMPRKARRRSSMCR
jgi:hypothetical protein